MTLVTPDLKDGVKKLVERLSSPDYPKSVGPTTATARMIGPQASRADWPGYSVLSDEPPSIGGGDTAPAPSSIFVASIGFAENVIFARQAALKGLDLESLVTTVEASWDRRGIFEIAEADPSITDLLVVTEVITTATPEEAAEVLRLTDRRCPMTRTLSKAAKVRRRLLVNGAEVRL